MILVNTGIWVDHLRAGHPRLIAFLEDGQVLAHSRMTCELALGHLDGRSEMLGSRTSRRQRCDGPRGAHPDRRPAPLRAGPRVCRRVPVRRNAVDDRVPSVGPRHATRGRPPGTHQRRRPRVLGRAARPWSWPLATRSRLIHATPGTASQADWKLLLDVVAQTNAFVEVVTSERRRYLSAAHRPDESERGATRAIAADRGTGSPG